MIHIIRKIKRSPISFSLGQLSLVLGVVSCLIIFSFISLHESFDTFHSESENIQRVIRIEKDQRQVAKTEGKLKGRLEANFTNIPVTHFMKLPVDITFEYESKAVTEQNGLLVDENFFSVMDFEPIHGNVASYLTQPNAIVLTETAARKIFGEGQLGLNETVYFQSKSEKVALTVTGIIKDLPPNSSLKFNYLITGASTVFWNDESPWTVFNTFIKTNSLIDKGLILDYLNKEVEQDVAYGIQALRDIHLSSGIEFDIFSKFDKKYLSILSSTGYLIILITFFNFLNMFYTKILSRIREITTRKVLGSTKFSIARKLFAEIEFNIAISILLSILLLLFLKNPIYNLLGFDPTKFYSIFDFATLFAVAFLLTAVLVLLITTQIFGYNTQLGLKGKLIPSKLGFDLGKTLLTVQLMVALFSITYGYVISEQTSLLKNTDVGYSYKNVLTVKRPDNVGFNTWQNLEQNLRQQSPIVSTGLAVFPSIGEYNSMTLKDLKTEDNYTLYWIGVDHNYIPTMEIDLISGRNFDQELQSDEQAVIINEKALKIIGGEKSLGNNYRFRKKPVKIIGVVRDFNHQSLKEEVQPMIMSLNNPNPHYSSFE